MIEQRLTEQLAGAVWAPLFQRRISTRRYGPLWVVHPGADLREGGPWIYAGSDGRVLRVDFTSPSQRALRVGAVLILLIGVTVLVSRFYPSQWCGTEVTGSGRTVTICRDPEVTDPAIVALGLVVLAALGVFYTEISGFGISMKRAVDEAGSNARTSLELIDDLQAVRVLVQETQADLAGTNVETDKRLRALEHALDDLRAAAPELAGPRPPPEASALATSELVELADSYNLARSTMVAGPDRSTQMERIFAAMRSTVPRTAAPEHVSRVLLEEVDRGRRLAAYAYLIEHPDPGLAPIVVDAAEQEDKPFGQYCALRALRRLVEAAQVQMPAGLVGRLHSIAVAAGRGTDRAREIATILATNSLKPPPTT